MILTLDLEASALGPASPSLKPPFALNNNFFQKFMQTCIERVRDQAPNAKVRKDILDRLVKPQNANLYYSHFHMKCYYFCQQCEDYFKVARFLDHKRLHFTAGFRKDRIVNRWQ